MFSRLRSHARGRRRGDPFCAYVGDHLSAPACREASKRPSEWETKGDRWRALRAAVRCGSGNRGSTCLRAGSNGSDHDFPVVVVPVQRDPPQPSSRRPWRCASASRATRSVAALAVVRFAIAARAPTQWVDAAVHRVGRRNVLDSCAAPRPPGPQPGKSGVAQGLYSALWRARFESSSVVLT